MHIPSLHADQFVLFEQYRLRWLFKICLNNLLKTFLNIFYVPENPEMPHMQYHYHPNKVTEFDIVQSVWFYKVNIFVKIVGITDLKVE